MRSDRMPGRGPVLMGAVAALLVAACTSSSPRTGPPEAGAGEGLPEDFFDRPLGALGSEVSDVAAAGLPFEPLVPDRLGPALHRFVYVSPGDPLASAAAWVFDLPDVGRFVVIERPDDLSEEGLEAEASPVPSPGCATYEVQAPSGDRATLTRCAYAKASLSTLRSGRTALVIHGESVTSATWVEPLIPIDGTTADLEGWNLEVTVMGLAEDLTPEEAIAVANQIASPQ